MTPVEPTRTPTAQTQPRDTGEPPLVRVMCEIRAYRRLWPSGGWRR